MTTNLPLLNLVLSVLFSLITIITIIICIRSKTRVLYKVIWIIVIFFGIRTSETIVTYGFSIGIFSEDLLFPIGTALYLLLKYGAKQNI